MKNSGQNHSNRERDEENLVMFPAARTFPETETLNDPLDELLNEFSHLVDVEFAPELPEEPVQMRSIGEQVNWRELPPERLIGELKNQLEALQEAHDRINYYLSDIEGHIPSRR